MSVIKGLAFFFFVLGPGFVLFAVIAGGGGWVLLNGAGLAATNGLEFIGVPSNDTDVVLKTLVVVFFACVVALSFRRSTSHL